VQVVTKFVTAVLAVAASFTFTATAFATSNPIASHRFVSATIFAQRCLGYRPTLLDEIRLAQIVRPDVSRRISSLDINGALRSASRASVTECGSPEATQGETVFREEVLPLLRDVPANGRRSNSTDNG